MRRRSCLAHIHTLHRTNSDLQRNANCRELVPTQTPTPPPLACCGARPFSFSTLPIDARPAAASVARPDMRPYVTIKGMQKHATALTPFRFEATDVREREVRSRDGQSGRSSASATDPPDRKKKGFRVGKFPSRFNRVKEIPSELVLVGKPAISVSCDTGSRRNLSMGPRSSSDGPMALFFPAWEPSEALRPPTSRTAKKGNPQIQSAILRIVALANEGVPPGHGAWLLISRRRRRRRLRRTAASCVIVRVGECENVCVRLYAPNHPPSFAYIPLPLPSSRAIAPTCFPSHALPSCTTRSLDDAIRVDCVYYYRGIWGAAYSSKHCSTP